MLAFILVRAKHMVTGYDHLLFLAGVIFYLSGFKDIVRFFTVFTIGHSIVLISATYCTDISKGIDPDRCSLRLRVYDARSAERASTSIL